MRTIMVTTPTLMPAITWGTYSSSDCCSVTVEPFVGIVVDVSVVEVVMVIGLVVATDVGRVVGVSTAQW